MEPSDPTMSAKCGSHQMAMGDIIGDCEFCSDLLSELGKLRAENERLNGLIEYWQTHLKRQQREIARLRGEEGRVMDLQQLRDLFADELGESEQHLAAHIRDGTDNSNGGTAAIRAMEKAVAAERERCLKEIDQRISTRLNSERLADRLIIENRELRAEIERLRTLLTNLGYGPRKVIPGTNIPDAGTPPY